MLAHSPEGVRPYLEDFAQRLQFVERQGFIDARVTAAAMLRGRYPNGFWDTKFAPWPYPAELPKLLKEVGILNDTLGSTDGSVEIYRFHTVGAIGAYGNPSRFLQTATSLFGADLGINIPEINRSYPKAMRPSFWNSIGGNVLMSSIHEIDDRKFQAGLLGLLATRRYFENAATPPPLSQMIYYAADSLGLVEGDSYRDLPDYRIAKKCLDPMYGHLALRWLAKHVAGLERHALIPGVKRKSLS